MLEIKKHPDNKDEYQLFLDDSLIDKADITKYDSRTHSIKHFTIAINNYEDSAKVTKLSFNDIPSEVACLELDYELNWSLLPCVVDIRQMPGNSSYEISFKFVGYVQWRGIYSLGEYFEELGRFIEEANDPSIKSSSYGREVERIKSLAGNIYFINIPGERKIASEIERCLEILRSFHEEVNKYLVNLQVQGAGDIGEGTPATQKIIRSIEFPPQYHNSGITILSYFATVLRQKKLAENVKVSIEQDDRVVRLIIESPTDGRELIERTLETYTLVVSGKLPMGDLTVEPYEVLELKSQLRIAHAQMENQRELLAFSKSEVESLRYEFAEAKASLAKAEQRSTDESTRFFSILEGLISHNADLSSTLREISKQAAVVHNSTLTSALESLRELIERGLREEDREEFIQKVEIVRQENSGIFRQVSDILIKGAISGSAGNYLYSWLQTFMNSLPK